ncbi:Calcium-binding EF-hand family protein, putative [Theobroma cacao]|uniref:Calcium-binding EF-hand family protein, putative n=1 Tax=Theobroma cacao TaxID=3641 RepID=A0A061FC62_THECC|nr:Calcium-binding EF-hand family protein, putative [Theobroma cacao]
MFLLHNKDTAQNPIKKMPFYYQTSGKSAPINYDVQQIRKIFLDCDIDGNKVLTKEEIKHAFDRLGAAIPGYRAWRGLHHADANNDGCISMDELDELVRYANGLGYKIK